MGGDFLGSLGGLAKLVDPGALAHAVADAILPPELQWMGGLVGAAVDLQAGNPFGAIKEGLDSIKDLNELSAKKQPPSFAPDGGWRHEPPPPPSATWATTANASATATTTVTTTTTVTASGSAQSSGTLRATPPAAQNLGATAMDFAQRHLQAERPTTQTSPAGAWRVTPSATRSTSIPPPTPWRSFASNPAQIASGSGLRPPVQDPSALSKDQFMGMDNESFMKAIRDGKIPKEISDSPAAMQALQARMNQISEMNQLMTSMIQAMHQMQMAVIQNVRV